MLKLGVKLVPDILVEYTKSKPLRTIPVIIPNNNHEIEQKPFSNLERAWSKHIKSKSEILRPPDFTSLGKGENRDNSNTSTK
jgi:hypothetical protein